MGQAITLLELTICQTKSVGEFASAIKLHLLNKLCNFISPSQSSDEFENFFYSLDSTVEALTQKYPSLTALIGDFNAKFNK